MTRWWSDGAARLDFQYESRALRPADLTERVRLLDARLRATQRDQLTEDEERALEALLRTVHRLTRPGLSGGG